MASSSHLSTLCFWVQSFRIPMSLSLILYFQTLLSYPWVPSHPLRMLSGPSHFFFKILFCVNSQNSGKKFHSHISTFNLQQAFLHSVICLLLLSSYSTKSFILIIVLLTFDTEDHFSWNFPLVWYLLHSHTYFSSYVCENPLSICFMVL